ncbi:OmpW family outer membrane protein [uncultured Shewanella sp.]|uniref:outer membrane protein n=1 Tax=uncultured Shewanella sp. TaxID=173975 RepID=UPI0026184805|nr:OmpW family outer membrane protein [uncultured Shewanella sp.]
MKAFPSAAVLLLTLGSINTVMAETSDNGFYVGGDIGSTQLKIQGESDSAASLGVYGGYNFNEWFAVEGHVFGTGDYDTGLEGQSGTFNGDTITVTKTELSASGLTIAPKVTWHINEIFSAYAKAGLSYMKVDTEIGVVANGVNINTSANFDGWGYVLGAGVNAAITPHLVVRLGYEYMNADIDGDVNVNVMGLSAKQNIDLDDTKLSQFSLGLHYQF